MGNCALKQNSNVILTELCQPPPNVKFTRRCKLLWICLKIIVWRNWTETAKIVNWWQNWSRMNWIKFVQKYPDFQTKILCYIWVLSLKRCGWRSVSLPTWKRKKVSLMTYTCRLMLIIGANVPLLLCFVLFFKIIYFHPGTKSTRQTQFSSTISHFGKSMSCCLGDCSRHACPVT